MAQPLTDGWKAPHPHPPAQTKVSAVLQASTGVADVHSLQCGN